MPLLNEKMYDYFLFENQEINNLLNKSILFKDILFSVYKNEDYFRIEFNNNCFLPPVIVKETDFLLNNLLPITYLNNLLYTPKIIPEFTTEKDYKKITESYILDQWNEKMNYNKLIIHALISKTYLNKNIMNIETKKIFAIFNKKIKNYIMNFASNSSYSLRTSYKRKNYINFNLFNVINKKKIAKEDYLLRYRKNFVKKKKK